MLEPAREVLGTVANISRASVDAFLALTGEKPTLHPLKPPPRVFMEKVLHILHNCPVEEDKELYVEMLKFVLERFYPEHSELFIKTCGAHAAAKLVLLDTQNGLKLGEVKSILIDKFHDLTVQLVAYQSSPEALAALWDSDVPAAVAAAALV